MTAKPRRFDASPEMIVRDLAKVYRDMGATRMEVATATPLAKYLVEALRKVGITVVRADPATTGPLTVIIYFWRDGLQYRFFSKKWSYLVDNFRAAQWAISLLYRVYDTYGVTREEDGETAEQEQFRALFGGHLLLGDGQSWYSVLGVLPEAGPDEIRRAFNDLAKVCHPDVPGGSEARFKEVVRARDRGLRAARERARIAA